MPTTILLTNISISVPLNILQQNIFHVAMVENISFVVYDTFESLRVSSAGNFPGAGGRLLGYP